MIKAFWKTNLVRNVGWRRDRRCIRTVSCPTSELHDLSSALSPGIRTSFMLMTVKERALSGAQIPYLMLCPEVSFCCRHWQPWWHSMLGTQACAPQNWGKLVPHRADLYQCGTEAHKQMCFISFPQADGAERHLIRLLSWPHGTESPAVSWTSGTFANVQPCIGSLIPRLSCPLLSKLLLHELSLQGGLWESLC